MSNLFLTQKYCQTLEEPRIPARSVAPRHGWIRARLCRLPCAPRGVPQPPGSWRFDLSALWLTADESFEQYPGHRIPRLKYHPVLDSRCCGARKQFGRHSNPHCKTRPSYVASATTLRSATEGVLCGREPFPDSRAVFQWREKEYSRHPAWQLSSLDNGLSRWEGC